METVAKRLTGFQTLQQLQTTRNKQGVRTDAMCNIQHWWEYLANNVASVCTGLKSVTWLKHYL